MPKPIWSLSLYSAVLAPRCKVAVLAVVEVLLGREGQADRAELVAHAQHRLRRAFDLAHAFQRVRAGEVVFLVVLAAAVVTERRAQFEVANLVS
jgi:hypothetical protein